MAETTASGTPLTPEQRNALKAFKKRLKLARLDDESRLGGHYTTSGSRSGIVGIAPPSQYPPTVWDELVQLGKLRSSGGGAYELVEQQPM